MEIKNRIPNNRKEKKLYGRKNSLKVKVVIAVFKITILHIPSTSWLEENEWIQIAVE